MIINLLIILENDNKFTYYRDEYDDDNLTHCELNDLSDEIQNLIKSNVLPLIDYRLKMIRSYVIKYYDNTNNMAGHYDIGETTLVVNLNNNYEGGYTRLPLLKYNHKPQDHPAGTGFIFKPNNVNAYHDVSDVTEGVRYAIIFNFCIEGKEAGIFYDIKKNIIKRMVVYLYLFFYHPNKNLNVFFSYIFTFLFYNFIEKD
jgi:hypothetical protein